MLVDFYAECVLPRPCHLFNFANEMPRGSWCGPCKMLSPILERLAGDVETKTGTGRPIDLLTVDTDVHGALAQKYQVRGSPNSLVHI